MRNKKSSFVTVYWGAMGIALLGIFWAPNAHGISAGDEAKLSDAQGAAQTLLQNYNSWNTDGQAGLTFNEAQAGLSGLTQLVFDQIDTNGDAAVSNHELIVATAPGDVHSADTDANHKISLSELLRVIQFFNSHALSCQAGTEDGYLPAAGDHSCLRYAADTKLDWRIDLGELLRLIQIFNYGAYAYCPNQNTEDAYCPVQGEGEGEGQIEGSAEGEGQAEGQMEGAAEGEGQAEGQMEGAAEGEGQMEGMAEGEIEGQLEGETEGQLEGQLEGQVEGQAEGQVEGQVEGQIEGEPLPATDGTHVVLGYNDLGMHCMNEDFSEFMILPPYNTVHAQVIRRGAEPVIVTSGVTISYHIPGNTTSVTKTNFWDYAEDLLGVALTPDVGLTGHGLSGAMTPTGDNDWFVTGIPITPLDDQGNENPYMLANIVVTKNASTVAATKTVVPVSWEISCDLCHMGAGISTATHILRSHDRLHGTQLEQAKPVFCGGCHGQAPLGTTGTPALSHAMHSAHASRMALAGLDVDCYACHPGIRTQCLRDVHYAAGYTCTDCHGNMSDVGNASRSPWVDEPRCGTCHVRPEFQFEQPGKLYRDSKGHQGVHCAACHGSPHAITPTVNPEDNVQAELIQGHAGKINTCSVCHIVHPGEAFEHQLGDDK